MTLNELASKEVIFRTNKTSVATKKLISMVEHKPIRDYLKGSVGIPIDKIAEFVGAYILGHKLVDAHGYDTIGGTKKVEIKWSFLNRTPTNTGHKRASANIGNLLTKNCDLMVIVCDDYLPPSHKDYIRIFLLPSNIWKHHWTKNSATMGFKTSSWYSQYRLAI
jgi:hypothetical protein